MATVTFDEETLRTLTARAMLDVLGPEKREELLLAALQGVMGSEKPKNSWEKAPPSSLELAFTQAVRETVFDEVHTLMKEDKYRARVAEVVRGAVDKAFDHPATGEAIEGAIIAALTRKVECSR